MFDRKLTQVWISAVLVLLAGGLAAKAGTEGLSMTQVAGNVDVVAGLVTQGLRGATSNPPINIGTGNVTAGGLVTPDSNSLEIDGTTVASDVAAGTLQVQGQNAYAQASTNIAGGNASVGGGVGSTFYTIVTASSLSGATFTVQVNGTTQTLTDGADFTHSGTNSTEATNLAAAISITGCSATAVGAVVYVTPTTGTYYLHLYTSASSANATATNGTYGSTTLSSGQISWAPGQYCIIGGTNSGSANVDVQPLVINPINQGAGNALTGTSSNLIIGSSQQRSFFDVLTFGSITGNTFTVKYFYQATSGNVFLGSSAAGASTTFTAVASGATGTQFNAVTSNNQTATNLAAAINANISPSILTATASGALCYVTASPGTQCVTLTTNANGANATASTGNHNNTYFTGNLVGSQTEVNSVLQNPNITGVFNVTATGTGQFQTISGGTAVFTTGLVVQSGINANSGLPLFLQGGPPSYNVPNNSAAGPIWETGGHANPAGTSFNAVGGAINVAPGLGPILYTISTASSLSGATFTLSASNDQGNSGNIVLTDGTTFTHSGTNSVEATNLAGAINANATLPTYLVAVASSNLVYIFPLAKTYACTITDSSLANAPVTNTGYANWNNYATTLSCPNNPAVSFGTGAVTCGNISSSGKFTSYNGISTAGMAVPLIVADANAAAQSAANSSIATYSNPASDASFEVSMTCNVTAATSISAPLQVAYTDVSNTAQTMTLPVQKANGTGGTYLASGLIIATGDYSTPTARIRCKASTSVTLKTGTGTYTGVTYSASGTIKKLN